MNDPNPKTDPVEELLVDVILSERHAQAVSAACDLHNRMHLGQIHVLGELVRFGGIKVRDDLAPGGFRPAASDECDAIDERLKEIERLLGHRGGSFGVGAQALDQPPRCSYEVHKAIDKALWDEHHPGETWHVASSGVGPRYAQGPAPTARVTDARDLRQDEAGRAQAIWRCAIGDVVSGLDVLKDAWTRSRRKSERDAGGLLARLLDIVHATRNPAPSSYREANAVGKALAERIRAALAEPGREEGDAI